MSDKQKMTGLAFDASQVAPASITDPIPAGWYNSEITDCEVVPVKGRNGGTRVKFEYTVISGDFKGRKFFGSVNIKNPNAQAQEIGQKELSAICHAVNVIQVSDTKQFIGKTLQVKVKVKPEDKENGYDASNEPKAYKPLEGAVAPGAVAAPGFAAGPPPFAAAPPVAAPVADFPPQGWLPHPASPGYFYSGNECLTEADLRARFAPAAPVAPVAPPVAPPVPAALPAAPAAPVATFPPAGWLPHPQSPGFYYTATGQVMSEADLRASLPPVTAAPAAPAVPAAPPVPAAPAIPAAPAMTAPPIPAAPVGAEGVPPWLQHAGQ